MRKPHPLMLGSTKIVYGREEDPENAIIIRNLYPTLKPNKKVFGILTWITCILYSYHNHQLYMIG